jgi:PAS domain S-box-containing protein
VQFHSDPDTSPWFTRFPLLVLGAGLVMTLLLYGILWTVARSRSDAMAIAERATRDLRTQLSFTQQLLESIPNPVFFKDALGHYLGCNRAFEEYIGLTRDEIIGKTVHEVSDEDVADRSVMADRELLARPGTQTYETSVIYAKDGTRHDVMLNKAAFYTPGGEIAGLVGVCVDPGGGAALRMEGG